MVVIQIHATKKLAAKLPADALREPEAIAAEAKANPLTGWHGNLLTIQRRNCVLLVHDATRFGLFIPALLKADFARLDWHFADTLMNTLLKAGMGEAELVRAEQLLTVPGTACLLGFDTDCDRSVQGTLNQMKGELEHMIAYHGINISDSAPYSISAWLSNRPCTIKGRKDCLWPMKEMKTLLGN